MQREISICYTKTTYEGHTFKNENKRKSLRYIFVKTRAHDIPHDENAMSSLIIQSTC